MTRSALRLLNAARAILALDEMLRCDCEDNRCVGARVELAGAVADIEDRLLRGLGAAGDMWLETHEGCPPDRCLYWKDGCDSRSGWTAAEYERIVLAYLGDVAEAQGGAS